MPLGIPVIDLSPRPSEGPGAFSLVGPETVRTVDGELGAQCRTTRLSC